MVASVMALHGDELDQTECVPDRHLCQMHIHSLEPLEGQYEGLGIGSHHSW